LVLAIAGCSGVAPVPDPSPSVEEFRALALSALEDAKADGANEQQLELIEQAANLGSVSFETVQSAVDATFACFESAGIRYEVLPPRVESGISYPDYAFEGGESTAVADACVHANSEFVEVLYMRQPAAVEASDSAFEAGMPVLITCLRGLGYELEDDITADELKTLLVMQESDIGTPREQEALDRFACVREAGIDSY